MYISGIRSPSKAHIISEFRFFAKEAYLKFTCPAYSVYNFRYSGEVTGCP